MPPVTPGNQIAGYRILAEVGKGAASELYAVQDPRTKQVWALKQVHKTTEKDQRFLDQCEQEYIIGSKLDHPNIRRVIRLIKNRKLFRTTDYVLIMELVDGISLDRRLPRNYTIATHVFQQIADALSHMHERGFVHADMKPSNVLVTEDGDVKIIDLGQSCPTGTVKKRIQGTPGYMAPEQAHRRAITERTDIYNFGAMMYWVLVREVIPTVLPPKNKGINGGSSNQQSLVKGTIDVGLIERPVPPHEKNPLIHPLMSKIIMDCVELDPERRPPSMRDVAGRLTFVEDVVREQERVRARGAAAAEDGDDDADSTAAPRRREAS